MEIIIIAIIGVTLFWKALVFLCKPSEKKVEVEEVYYRDERSEWEKDGKNSLW